MVEETEELTNGIEHNPEMFSSAQVTINMQVAEVLGRPVDSEEERDLFLELINVFFSSEPVLVNLKMFIQFYMNENAVPQKIVVPDKPKLIIPGN